VSDDEAMDMERAMLALDPGQTLEVDGVMLFHTEHGMRGAMNAADWHALMKDLRDFPPPKLDENGNLAGLKFRP